MHLYSDNIDRDTKNKAVFVLKAKGTSLSQEVKKIIEQNAKEFEEIIKK